MTGVTTDFKVTFYCPAVQGSFGLRFLKIAYTFPLKQSHAMPRSRQHTSSPRRGGIGEIRSGPTFHQKAVAEIGPSSLDVVMRKPGALRGKIKAADDFDSLPVDVLKSLEDET